MNEFANWSSRPRPVRAALVGRYCRLEPLDPARHGDDLFAASMADGAEERFRYLPDVAQSRADFSGWLRNAIALDDPMFFAVVDEASGRCEGRQSLMRIDPEHGVIEIGHILWGPTIVRTRVATEALFLLARYAFDELRYRRLEWKCDASNESSMSAAHRFGFVYEGTFRHHRVVMGRNRDTAWFAIIDTEWPTVRSAFENWLDPANFDSQGLQKVRLADLRTPAQ